MKVVVQRSKESTVSVNGKVIGKIEKGYVLLSSFTYGDNIKIVDKMIDKILNLRIFKDENDKMNLSILNINGEILNISQFTLYADTSKGNRPNFLLSLDKENALYLYNYMNERLKSKGIVTETGEFGSDMFLSTQNDGPVTIILDSKDF